MHKPYHQRVQISTVLNQNERKEREYLHNLATLGQPKELGKNPQKMKKFPILQNRRSARNPALEGEAIYFREAKFL